jgi:hypothetical protein
VLPQIGAIAPITTCPHCSVLVNGSCEVCQEGSTHPSCVDCVGGRHSPPFYRSQMFIAVITAITVATVSGVALAFINRKMSSGHR